MNILDLNLLNFDKNHSKNKQKENYKYIRKYMNLNKVIHLKLYNSIFYDCISKNLKTFIIKLKVYVSLCLFTFPLIAIGQKKLKFTKDKYLFLLKILCQLKNTKIKELVHF